MEKTYCVYKITDIRTDEIIYIGKTCDFNRRKSEHLTQNKQCVDKHMADEGRENFEMSIIQDDITNNDTAVKTEDACIVEYQPIMNKQRSGHIEKDDPERYMRDYHSTEKYRNYQGDYQRDYQKSEKWRDYQRDYYSTDKWRDYHKEYNKSEKYREYQRQYRLKKKLEKQKQDGLF